ncbi:MAG: DNA polymerase III subunit delta, partial [bacterium]|nr:DNA polymerase III subunit delta [bacterium]
VKEIQRFKPSAMKLIEEYVAKPSQSTCLILSAPVKDLSGKSYKIVKSKACNVNCRPFYSNETISWIKNYINTKKLDIEIQACNALYEIVGNSLFDLVNEIEKIVINIYPRQKITAEDVQQTSSMLRQHSVFDLCDAVGEKKLKKSLSILNNLIDRGERATGIVIQLNRHWINMLKLIEMKRLKRLSTAELQAVTRLHPFFLAKIQMQTNNFTAEQIRQGFSRLAEADLHLKTSYQPPKLVLELLIYQLINK